MGLVRQLGYPVALKKAELAFPCGESQGTGRNLGSDRHGDPGQPSHTTGLSSQASPPSADGSASQTTRVTADEADVQRGQMTCPRSYSSWSQTSRFMAQFFFFFFSSSFLPKNVSLMVPPWG